jgi:hypothetical protein
VNNRIDTLLRFGVFSADPASAAERAAREKLQSLRQISNVIQALENLTTQCGDHPHFRALHEQSVHWLADARAVLQATLHGVEEGDNGA